jgi:hypothetical protein
MNNTGGMPNAINMNEKKYREEKFKIIYRTIIAGEASEGPQHFYTR